MYAAAGTAVIHVADDLGRAGHQERGIVYVYPAAIGSVEEIIVNGGVASHVKSGAAHEEHATAAIGGGNVAVGTVVVYTAGGHVKGVYVRGNAGTA